jgi:hypothetical protein
MAAFDPATLERWRALAIVDRDGSTVGTISEFYLDRETGHPTWALVSTGLLGTSQSFVPLVHASEIADGLQVPYEKRHIKDSPRVDLHDELSPEEEAALFAHYGVDYEPAAEGPAAGTPVVGDPVVEGPAAGAPGVAVDGEPVPGEPPGPDAADPAADAGSGDSPAVPPEPGPTDPTAVAEGEGGSVPADATEALPVPHEPAEADGGHHTQDADTVTAEIPDEPGTTPAADPGADTNQFRDGRPGADPDRFQASPTAADPDRFQATSTAADPARATQADPGPDPDQLRDGPGDPDLGRTAPVEPGLPGSTAASPYGATATVEKGAGPAGHPADEPLEPPSEAGWAPGAVDPPAGASDRWREAKLAAERDRIARATAAQPEERSPLERARRRLERLVGVGQEPADHDEMSPADREEAERARRARLGLDEEDHHRR